MLPTSKALSGIDREMRAFTTAIDAQAAGLLVAYPDAGLTVRRTPSRIVLQAGEIGVSISLFRSRAGMAASAEVVLAEWAGQLTVPGSSVGNGRSATCVRTQEFRIVTEDDVAWSWSHDESVPSITSADLAATCIGAMAGALQR